MAVFFISCPLHFENQLAEELKSFWFEMMDLDGQPTREPLPDLEIEPGGIQIQCADHLGYQINFFSKLALRVLIRIHRFTARFYDQFEKEIKALPLNKWIDDKNVAIKIESAKSRLNHERNLIEAATKALLSSGFNLVNKANTKIYIRIVKDNATVSLDTSGDHLHMRGYAVYRGDAPLRENLAALMVQQVHQRCEDFSKIGVIDPFVGSGTTLFEAASFCTPNFKRRYAWLSFKNKPKLFSSESWVKNFRWLQNPKNIDLIGIDIDQAAINNLRQNALLFAESYPDISINLKSILADSNQLSELQLGSSSKPYWVISNPPYGIRLNESSAHQIFRHIESLVDLTGAVILHPESMFIDFKHLKLSSQLDFSNQGLKIKLSVFTK